MLDFEALGLKPFLKDDAGIVHGTYYDIPTGSTYGITGTLFQNMPVKFDANNLPTVVTSPTDDIVGSFQGVEWVDPSGFMTIANRWFAGTTPSAVGAIDAYSGKKMRIIVEDTVNAFYTITVGNPTIGISTFTTAQNGYSFNLDTTTSSTLPGGIGNANFFGVSTATLNPTPVSPNGDAGPWTRSYYRELMD